MAKYKEILYGTVFPNGNLTDFPKLFSIVADADIAAELSGGGGIELYLADGTTPVPFGLYPSTDLASGTILMRVKTDLLTAASTGDVLLRLRYGAELTTSEDKAGVASNYDYFMPLEEDPSGSAPQIFDWVSESNVGTSSGSMTSGDLVSGQVGNDLDFDGTDDFITLSADWSAPTDFDISFIFKSHDFGIRGIAAHTTNVASLIGFLNSATVISTRGNVANLPLDFTVPTVSSGVFYCLRVIRVSGTVRLYLNGVESSTGGLTNSDTYLFNAIGSYPMNTTFSFVGEVDECLLSTSTGSIDDITYQYEDYFNNEDTFSLGDEQNETEPMILTQLHPGVLSGKRYVGFSGKRRPRFETARTQMHPNVLWGRRYGSFEGKPEVVYVSTGNFWLYF